MGRRGMSNKLACYLEEKFNNTKSDLFAVFMDCGLRYLKENGFMSMINQHSWMFLGSFESLRKNIINNYTIYSLLHLGSRAFDDIGGEVVQSSSFTIRNKGTKDYVGTYFDLKNENSTFLKEEYFLDCKLKKNDKNMYNISSNRFLLLPGCTLAYWASKDVVEIFNNSKRVIDVAQPRQGLATADNNRFLRNWYEVNINKIGLRVRNSQEAIDSKKKWFPYNKGGEFRKWYGNNEYIVNWENDGFEIKTFTDSNGRLRSRPQNTEYYFKEGFTWTLISTSNFGVRYTENGFLFDVGGFFCFSSKRRYSLFNCIIMYKIKYEIFDYTKSYT